MCRITGFRKNFKFLQQNIALVSVSNTSYLHVNFKGFRKKLCWLHVTNPHSGTSGIAGFFIYRWEGLADLRKSTSGFLSVKSLSVSHPGNGRQAHWLSGAQETLKVADSCHYISSNSNAVTQSDLSIRYHSLAFQCLKQPQSFHLWDKQSCKINITYKQRRSAKKSPMWEENGNLGFS